MNLAGKNSHAASAPTRRPSAAAALAALAAVVICIAIGASLSATLSHEADELRLRNELAVTADFEALLDLHVAANTDFLRGVSVAGYGSRGWPVGRAAAVAQIYERLQRALADVPG